jgi:predicted nucleotidyltransferase
MTSASIEIIFRSLNEAGARYLVVGGLAVVAHGYVRLTADVDLVTAMDDENIRKTVAALEDHPATEVDLFLEPPFDFEEVYRRSLLMDFTPGVPIRVIGRDDLVAMKRAAGRPQDLEDARRLQSLDSEEKP